MLIETFRKRLGWLRARQSGLGGSDAPILMRVAPWRNATRLRVYMEKTAPITAADADIERLPSWQEWGLRHEPSIALAVQEKLDRVVHQVAKTPYHLARNPKMPAWTFASLDRLVEAKGRKGPGPLNLKTSTLPAEWENGIPIWYQVQLQHEMAVADASWGMVAVLVNGHEFLWGDVERNDRFIDTMLETESTFWHQHVLPRVPPEPGAGDSKLLNGLWAEEQRSIVLPPEAADWMDRRTTLAAEIKQREAQIEEVELKLKTALGPAVRGLLPDGRNCTWKTDGSGTRVFRVNLKKGEL